MKITLALSALAGLVATAVSAAPTNSTLSTRAACIPTSLYWTRHYYVNANNRDPVKDLHSFQLIIKDTYNQQIEPKATKGKKKDNYKETRTSNDKWWSVEHTDAHDNAKVTLTIKGQKHVFNNPNDFWLGMPTWKLEYYTCVTW
ncbi:hypothetical protein BGZ95_005714 [Linnemannia exigua]|uniref:Uncharacterized protein n=1 Tax=Linnemannia exigua TaxID=604196 RepID=A0AAD4DGZ9_9FUNG|nr:hypothetical protein BGZ95_005714 [Linnemannia exigua]